VGTARRHHFANHQRRRRGTRERSGFTLTGGAQKGASVTSTGGEAFHKLTAGSGPGGGEKRQAGRPALDESFSTELSDRVEMWSAPKQRDEAQEARTEQQQRRRFGSREVRARAPSDRVQLIDAEDRDIAAAEIDR